MIEAHADGGFTVTGDHIPFYRLLVMRKGLQLEIKGIRMSRGRTCYALAKSEFGFKGNRDRVLAQLEDHIADHYPEEGIPQ
jgi:hypothetical protein|tara:strand:+ start:1880 stop:2122 length:243 start_codon:yes stop_codon:yes gene_type:complete